MKLIPALSLLAALTGSATQAQIVAGPFLPPTRGETWHMEQRDNECSIWRNFGPSDDPVVLRIARGGAMDTVDLVLAGRRFTSLGYHLRATLTLEPQSTSLESEAYATRIPDRSEGFLRLFDVGIDYLDGMTAVQDLLISVENTQMRLRLAGTRAALDALGTCHHALLTSWGIDPDEQERIQTPARTASLAANWVTTDDYPDTDVQGTVTTRLIIGIEGRVEQCIIAVSSGSGLLDATTCRVLTSRARYHPALDLSGQPMRSSTIRRVRWQKGD